MSEPFTAHSRMYTHTRTSLTMFKATQLSGTILHTPSQNGSGTVRALAWSTLWGGSILASGGDDTMVRLWNVSGRSTSWTKTETESAPPSQLTTPKFVLSGHTRRITSLAFSIDGSILASIAATQDSTVRLWDTATGRLLNAVDTAPVDGIVPELYGVAWQVRGCVALFRDCDV